MSNDRDRGANVEPAVRRLTAAERRQFDEDGFILVPNALTQREVHELTDAVDRFARQYCKRGADPSNAPLRMGNIVARGDCFLRLLDHPGILPLVVDVLGYRIHLRASQLDYRPPRVPDPRHETAHDRFLEWHMDAPMGGWPLVQDLPPFMELKVGYYLTDLTEPQSGALCLVRGSHREVVWEMNQGVRIPDPARVVEINVPAGTALIWRTSLLHRVTPNYSGHARKCLYYAYQHRWLRPSDYYRQTPELIKRCNALQRQLLGELAGGLEAADIECQDAIDPCSRYWTPRDEDIPVKHWHNRMTPSSD